MKGKNQVTSIGRGWFDAAKTPGRRVAATDFDLRHIRFSFVLEIETTQ